MQKERLPDYYELLKCTRKATTEELKKSYQKLALTVHPDKNTDCRNEERFLLLQKAWSVLRDPQSRRQYDARLNLQQINEPLLYDTLPLSNMTFHLESGVYKYDCRCGGTYILDSEESFFNCILIGCDECSFSIQVNK